MECERIRELLEAYALDALEAAERSNVERHLAGCADCREEVAALTEIVSLFPGALAAASPELPGEELKDRVIGAVSTHAGSSCQARPDWEEGQHPQQGAVPTGSVRRERSRSRLVTVALPALLLVISLMWGIGLTVALERERDLRAEYSDLLDDVVGQQEPVFEVIGFDDTNRQFLSPQQPDSTTYGKVFTRPKMPFVVVMAGRLPVAVDGATFHVWVTANGETTLAGELAVDENGFGLLVFTEDRPGPTYERAFVTLQPPGGDGPAGVEILHSGQIDAT